MSETEHMAHSSQGELQLVKVLQSANLLDYYDAFVSAGGDDLRQLCEAEDDEFLEIMALVGMSGKPLHVRRLQKALQDWAKSTHEKPASQNSNDEPEVITNGVQVENGFGDH